MQQRSGPDFSRRALEATLEGEGYGLRLGREGLPLHLSSVYYHRCEEYLTEEYGWCVEAGSSEERGGETMSRCGEKAV